MKKKEKIIVQESEKNVTWSTAFLKKQNSPFDVENIFRGVRERTTDKELKLKVTTQHKTQYSKL